MVVASSFILEAALSPVDGVPFHAIHGACSHNIDERSEYHYHPIWIHDEDGAIIEGKALSSCLITSLQLLIPSQPCLMPSLVCYFDNGLAITERSFRAAKPKDVNI